VYAWVVQLEVDCEFRASVVFKIYEKTSTSCGAGHVRIYGLSSGRESAKTLGDASTDVHFTTSREYFTDNVGV
jgi:hypothetical protein